MIRDSNIFKIAKPLFIVTVIRSFVTHPLLKMKNTFHHRLLQNPNFVINSYTSICTVNYFILLFWFIFIWCTILFKYFLVIIISKYLTLIYMAFKAPYKLCGGALSAPHPWYLRMYCTNEVTRCISIRQTFRVWSNYIFKNLLKVITWDL